MKQQIMYTLLMGIVLIACSTKNGPAKVESRQVDEEVTRFPIAVYDSLYHDIQNEIIPRVLDFNDIRVYLHDIATGNAYVDSAHIVQADRTAI